MAGRLVRAAIESRVEPSIGQVQCLAALRNRAGDARAERQMNLDALARGIARALRPELAAGEIDEEEARALGVEQITDLLLKRFEHGVEHRGEARVAGEAPRFEHARGLCRHTVEQHLKLLG